MNPERMKEKGVDYPPYNKDGVKMKSVMTEEEVREWFTEEELKGYPKLYHFRGDGVREEDGD